ncbi:MULTISPECIES: bacillithiol biosynthesis deacetylase BshB1 [Cohnella]|uniref:bacillithiol biosynthesis deacetylase BshB1 n=1 Tax=Cohnella TaxID=329857 RepID=UPI0009BBE945|nr:MULTISPECIES: bacillithiol biosynthesis deacetylase BshB1 [Cohnella]MBN2984278.1 bacillithiol biosynthesis deacetylase BshB1 [Cohnella algarum]
MSERTEFGLDLLAFGAHPDDVEIGMGGTLIKAAASGQRTGIVDLTRAEMSSNGDVATRKREADAATAVLGLAVRDNLELPDRGLSASDSSQVGKIVAAIRRYRPRVVFAPYFADRHPDHVMCSRMVEEAAFNAKLRRYMPEQAAWTVDMLYYYFINDMHAPQFVVDVTDVHERKMEALRAYRSQFEPAGDLRDWVPTPLTMGYLDNVAARDKLFGQARKFVFAEGFIAKGPISLDRF